MKKATYICTHMYIQTERKKGREKKREPGGEGDEYV